MKPAAAPAPARRSAAATDKLAATPEEMERLAAELIRAAGEERKRGEIVSARRVLDRAEARVVGYPALGWVYLARARMERELGVRAAALRYARAAAEVPGFDGRPDALRLVAELEREAAPQLDLAPASAPPPP